MKMKAKYKVTKNRDATEHCGVNAGGASWRDSSSKSVGQVSWSYWSLLGIPSWQQYIILQHKLTKQTQMF